MSKNHNLASKITGPDRKALAMVWSDALVAKCSARIIRRGSRYYITGLDETLHDDIIRMAQGINKRFAPATRITEIVFFSTKDNSIGKVVNLSLLP